MIKPTAILYHIILHYTYTHICVHIMYICIYIYIYTYKHMESSSSLSWLKQTYHGPRFTCICVINRGVRFHRVRDFEQYHSNGIPQNLSSTRRRHRGGPRITDRSALRAAGVRQKETYYKFSNKQYDINKKTHRQKLRHLEATHLLLLRYVCV